MVYQDVPQPGICILYVRSYKTSVAELAGTCMHYGGVPELGDSILYGRSHTVSVVEPDGTCTHYGGVPEPGTRRRCTVHNVM